MAVLKANRAMTQLLQSMPDFVMLLDENRQVVFANAALEKALGSELIGKQPGELLSCRHVRETAGGCGTTPSCRHCGVAQAMQGAQRGRSMVEECRITTEQDGRQEALDLRVWTNRVTIDGRDFTLFSSRDIADEKRKAFLERIFLHDLMNTASALRGATTLMKDEAADQQAAAARIGSLSSRIIEEINSQRQLIAAEANELVARPEALRSLDVVRSIHDAYVGSEFLNGRVLEIAKDAADVSFESDPSLLGRVVGNMTKNALEATAPGQAVTLGCRLEDGKVAFWVHNPTHMPEKVRLQIFNRSFSTRGTGRGLGTYSMKYLTEKYLGGDVSFTSTPEQGTTFVARYPLAMKGRVVVKEVVPQQGGALPTVVVADDEPVLRKVLTAFLRRAGVKVLAEVENGQQALDACRAHHPDVLLIDGRMPVMSGEDALLIIRDELPGVMSFLLTGETDQATLERSMAAGAHGYVAKGTPIPTIVQSVIGQWQVSRPPR